MGLGSSAEDSRKTGEPEMQVELEHVGQVVAEDERRKKRGVMEVTPRLIHTQRHHSLRKHRNAKG